MNKVFISCKESRIENNRSFYGCFYLGSFDYGLSLTIANALRRTLLAECSGLGIVSVTIENVTHEYSTLSGVRESVLDILLNLKEIVLKKSRGALCLPQRGRVGVDSKKNQEKSPWHIYKKKLSVYEQVADSYLRPVVGYLKVKGPGVIRAKDLILPPFIQCVDPEQYIATLSEDGSLCMKFIIMEGKNDSIQKQHSLIDVSLVQKRKTFLNELFALQEETLGSEEVLAQKEPFSLGSKKDLLEPLETGFSPTKGAKDSLTEKNVQKPNPQDFGEGRLFPSAKGPKRSPFVDNPKTPSSISVGLQRTSSSPSYGVNSPLFMNSMPLHLDTVFNPVTKVNYILEENSNKLVEDSNKKSTFVDEITSLLQSSDYLKKNIPSLFIFPESEFSSSTEETFSKNTKEGAAKSISVPSVTKQLPVSDKPAAPSPKEKEGITLNSKKLANLINMYIKSELNDLNHSLNPLKKQPFRKEYIIILEIWTNGSIHPSEVLKTGLDNLSSNFLNLQKTLTYSSSFLIEDKR